MNDSNLTIARNPDAQKAHRRQTFWQIAFPLILGILAVLALGVWTILVAVRGSDVSQSADASISFLLMPAMVITLIPLILFAGITYGLIWLKKNLPTAMFRVQKIMVKIRDGVITGADKTVEPMLRISSFVASLEALKRNKKIIQRNWTIKERAPNVRK